MFSSLLPLERQKSPSKNLILMVDNRPIAASQYLGGAPFHVLTTVLNYLYAQKNGYDFLHVGVSGNDLAQGVSSKYNKSERLIGRIHEKILQKYTHEARDRGKIGVYNKYLGLFQSSRWAILPVLTFILQMLQDPQVSTTSPPYQYIVVIESDTFFIPRNDPHFRGTLETFIDHWSSLSLTHHVEDANIFALNEQMWFINAKNLSSSEKLVFDWWKEGNTYAPKLLDELPYDDNRVSIRTRANYLRYVVKMYQTIISL